METTHYVALLASLVVLALSSDRAAGESGPETLFSIASDLAYNANTEFQPIPQLALVADVDNDGQEDYLLIGLNDKALIVTIVRVASVEFRVSSQLVFPISDSMQMAVCGWPTGWTSLPRSEAPLNALGQYPHGYEDCPECEEYLLITEGDCDPVMIYWDAAAADIAWWRA